MNYTKKTWEDGDVITSEALNNIENELETLEGADAPLAATATVTENESEKDVITMNVTAAELYAAASTGKFVKVTAVVGENATAESVVSFAAVKYTQGETVAYEFYFVNQEGTAFHSEALSGSDSVVLTEV